MEADGSELIAVYEVADAAVLHQQRDRIAAMFLRTLPGSPAGAANFAMDRFTSWISWTDPSRLLVPGRKRSTVSLPDPRRAKRVADDLLRDLRAALSDSGRNPLLREVGPHYLVPPGLRQVDVQPVFHREARAFDHWLCRYSVALPLRRQRGPRPIGVTALAADAATSATLHEGPASSGQGDVLGSTVEVRVDAEAQVIGYASRVTPLTGRHVLVPIVPPPRHDGDERHDSNAIVYLQDNFAMTRLPPYYLTKAGHHRGLYPASTHSLLVDILQRNRADGADVGAVILGGSGAFRIEWFSWQPDAVLTGGGVVSHGEGMSIRVTPGVHNMTAVVNDLRHGTRVEFSKLVFVPVPRAMRG